MKNRVIELLMIYHGERITRFLVVLILTPFWLAKLFFGWRPPKEL